MFQLLVSTVLFYTVLGCSDLTNPSTGVSDCPRRAYLCSNSVYYDLMTTQCPKTCGRCGSNTNTNSNSNCKDLLNPYTGVSDCPKSAYLCNNPMYYSLMTIQCPRTCNRCPRPRTTTSTSTSTSTSSSTSTTASSSSSSSSSTAATTSA